MRDKIKKISSSIVFETSLFLTICCILASSISVRINGSWTPASWALAIGGAAVLFTVLVWTFRVYITGKEVRQMPARWMLGIETASRILILIWIYIVSTPIAVILWAALFIWQEYKLIRDIRDGIY